MGRVIQDSDDENELPSPLAQREDISGGEKNVELKSSSVELLRGIQAAQNELATSTKASKIGNTGDMPGERMGILMSSSRREQAKKISNSSCKYSETLASENSECVEALRYENSHIRREIKDDWLPSTLQHDFVEHNPTVLFSEQSSTIPDNTMSQQRMIQQALVANMPPEFLTQDKKNPTQNSDSSIPWSAYKDSPKKTQASSPEKRSSSSIPSVVQSTSSSKRRSQTVDVCGSDSKPALCKSQDEGVFNANTSVHESKVPSQENQVMMAASPKTREIDPNLVQRPSQATYDQPNADSRGKADESKTDSMKSKNIKTFDTEALELEADELCLDIPREQSKFRALRSKSTVATENDQLRTEEEALGPRTKRRKTTHETFWTSTQHLESSSSVLPLASRYETLERATIYPSQPNKIDEIHVIADKENHSPSTQYRPAEASKISKSNSRSPFVEVPVAPTNGTDRHTAQIDELIPNATTTTPASSLHPTLSPTVASYRKAKAGRSHTIAIPVHSQRKSVVDSDESEIELSPVKASATNFGLSTKAPDAASMLGNPQATRSKRKVGCSRQVNATDLAAADAEYHDQETSKYESGEKNHEIKTASFSEKLKYSETNSDHSSIVLKISGEETPPAPSIRSHELAEQQVSDHVKTPESKSLTVKSSSHSPLNRGKVLYRVGLSRRARIAPLLKITRK
ncbi:hypothetical protein, variant [Verruconis gallopava]|uniref:Uncharacterized protein n=1 Tax=Verruconis gallopava TaxID=253628 RepID=A0A0D1XVE3_9PEZI|nr:hypothetical protein, variant [Verruconis gallopava]KIW06786.1 hypothetical protein, variant [Verruconis gallopava]